VPVILLTAKGATADKAKGLDLGADDYIAKPFHPDELAARVRAVLRRASGRRARPGVVHVRNVEIDLERRIVTRDGELVSAQRTEWLLLQHLAANAGKVVLHTELLTKVWGPEYRDDLQYLRVWISRVRRKLGAAPGHSPADQDVPGHRLPARRRGHLSRRPEDGAVSGSVSPCRPAGARTSSVPWHRPAPARA
jgi:two-component system KDP operon response regulator KdpE